MVKNKQRESGSFAPLDKKLDDHAMYMRMVEVENKRRWDTRQREVQSNLYYIRRLSVCEQVTTPRCSCGMHRGIRFIEHQQVMGEEVQVLLEDNVCPVEWWIKMGRLAFEGGELGSFHKEYPFDMYVGAYRL